MPFLLVFPFNILFLDKEKEASGVISIHQSDGNIADASNKETSGVTTWHKLPDNITNASFENNIAVFREKVYTYAKNRNITEHFQDKGTVLLS